MKKLWVVCFSGAIILSGCTSQSEAKPLKNEQITQLEKQREQMRETLRQQKLEIEQLEEQVQAYEKLTSDALNFLETDEAVSLLKQQFTYTITVNGESIPPNGEMNIESGDVEIVLSSRQPSFSIPDKWREKVELKGGLFDHISNLKPSADSRSGKDGTLNVDRSLVFSDMSPGTTIEFDITNELKERLKVSTNSIRLTIQ
ncbi:hypothetical protein LCM20_17040 [Halobacillus litoralis]|uniref:hypothetical protein n=1 Tax=Halobacillus litoralis TaxID=45668 RepID=UPI001CD5B2F7|nr:hypothetical protein [Halobacillus litoralis]MCA0972316.1 hypothetical protein [Halobacillus litoralis]